MNKSEWIRRNFNILIDKALIYQKTVYFEYDKLKLYVEVFDKLALLNKSSKPIKLSDSSIKFIGIESDSKEIPHQENISDVIKPEQTKDHPKFVKKLYKKLAVSLHPDKGGNNEEFIQLVTSYDNNDVSKLIELFIKHCTFDDFDIEQEDSEVLCELINTMEHTLNKIHNMIEYRLFDPGISQVDKIKTVEGICRFTGKSFEEVVDVILKGTEIITEQLENG